MSDPATILAPVREAPKDRPFVVAQLGQSLDGRIATPTGQSRWINGNGALDHLHRLRAHVDAVVIGVGTAMADDPLLNVRRVEGRNPARVVIDPSGRMTPDRRLLMGMDGCRRLVVRKAGCKPLHELPQDVETIDINATAAGRLLPSDVVAALAQRGLGKLLLEGGAHTVSDFLHLGAIDRLHVLVAPVILGSGTAGLNLPPIDKLAEARRPATRVHTLAGGEVLFDCDMREMRISG